MPKNIGQKNRFPIAGIRTFDSSDASAPEAFRNCMATQPPLSVLPRNVGNVVCYTWVAS